MDISEWRKANPVKAIRAERGISQQDFAIVLNVSGAMVRNWETGGHRPTEERVVQMAKALKAPGLVKLWEEWEAQRPTAL